MRRDKLFISYSHQDKTLFDEFRRHLGYWSEEGQIQVWSDENLKASERWREEIDKALERAAVAVLLISSDFLNSKFIREVELPALLGAREDGLLGIGNLFLRPSGVIRQDCLFEAKLASGETPRVRLTDYQGLNTPSTEITAFEGHARERQYEEAIVKLIQLYDQYKQTGRSTTRRTPRQHRLGIRLRLDGKHIKQRYLGPYTTLGEHRTLWAPVRRQLDSDKRGEALFQMLFGLLDEDQSAPILQKLLERTGKILPNPTVTAVRVCIETDSHELADLPWRECRWEGQSLTELGWTFEFNPLSVSTGLTRFPHIELHTPCPVLAITPALFDPADPDPGTENHLFSLQERLDIAWPIHQERVLKARTLSETCHYLRSRSPDIVYYCGRAQPDQETLRLALPSGNARWVALEDLAKHWAHSPPRILILTLLDDTSPEVGIRLQAWLPTIPLVLMQRGRLDDIQRARRSTLAWLHRMLEGDGLTDPVAALVETGGPYASAWTAYGTWRVHTLKTSPKERLARLLLDRWEQRSLVRAVVDEMLQQGHRRVTCFVAYGEHGNMVDLAGQQFLEYLRHHAAEHTHIKACDLSLPPDKTDFDVMALQKYVQRQIFSEGVESEAAWLAAQKPRSRDGTAPFLFIDWGCRGQADDSGLSRPALEAWIAYCAQVLVAACPDELSILCCLALERPKARYAPIERVLKRLQTSDAYTRRAFRLAVLPAFNDVDQGHLKEFLDGPDNSSCPDKLIGEMSRLIVTAAGGSFASTVELVERAEVEGWYDVYDELAPRYKDLIAAAPDIPPDDEDDML
jgi:hypothetical protein